MRLLPGGMLTEMAAANYRDFMAEHTVVPSSDPRAQKVALTGENISGAVVDFLREKGQAKRVQDFKWEFQLVESEQVNAWAMPGGKVAIYA